MWNPAKTIFVQISNLNVRSEIGRWSNNHGFDVLDGSGCDLIAVGYLFAVVERALVGDVVWSDYLVYFRESKDLTPCILVDAEQHENEEGLSNLHYVPEPLLANWSHLLDDLLQESLTCRSREEEVWFKEVVSSGAVNVPDEYGCLPLDWAVSSKSASTVQKLIDAGADVNACSERGVTALMIAFYRSQEVAQEIGKMLIHAGADFSRVDINGFSASDYAINTFVRRSNLLSTVPINAIHLAVANAAFDGDVSTLSELQSHDPPIKILNNALVMAVTKGHKACCQILLDHGADANGVGINGQSPLEAACWALNLSIVRLLVKSGACVNDNLLVTVCQASGDVPKSCCAPYTAYRRIKITHFLIKHGVDVNYRDDSGFTALQQATVAAEQCLLVRLLLKYGADPAMRDDC